MASTIPIVLKKYGEIQLDKIADPKNWEIWDAPKNEEILYQKFPEWTCQCPRSGYPDFGTIHLIIVPDKKIIELKCLKLWFNSYRDIGISHENATQEIADTLFNTLQLKYIFVLMEYTPRGNLTTFPMTERISRGFIGRDEINMIKEKIFNKII